ncbi:TonB-dependent receptor plug domain-containing protein [Ferrimonas senticii]|uniref:TonB-dependent receptor plug domain-containing protein n=1 Tax=Ferrimonas senticii TaxID=394566 RepID=UPI000402418B|nr:TonB-dependent receptor [Ferrimonas senticii]
MKSLRLSPLALMVAAGLSAQAMAADNSNVFSLGEIVVADQATGVRDIAINNVLTQETIEMVGAQTAADALSYMPGVHITQNNKGERHLNLQGFDQSRVLILLDGIPYYNTNEGKLNLDQIPANIIAKVEITKGASSVLYGPNGMGGVVNIITKQGHEGISGEISASVGEYGQNHQDASFSYGKGNFTVFGSIEHTGRDAFRLSGDYEMPEKVEDKTTGEMVQLEDGGRRINSDLESLSARLRAGYNNGTTAVYATVFQFETERGLPFQDNRIKSWATYTSYADITDYTDRGIDLNASHKVSDNLTLRGLAYYHTHTDNMAYYEGIKKEEKWGDSGFDDYSVGGALFADYRFSETHSLSISGNYKKDIHRKTFSLVPDHLVSSRPELDEGDSIEGYKNQLSTYSLAAEDTIHFGNLTVVSGIAWHRQVVDDMQGYIITENNNDTTDTFDPMIGMSYALSERARVFGSVAQKTRFATFNDMSSDDGKLHQLDPERSLSSTLGYEHQFDSELVSQFNFSLFHHDIKDRLSTIDVDNPAEEEGNGDWRVPVNIDESETFGTELSFSGELTEELRYTIDHTYTHARNKSDDVDYDEVYDVPTNEVSAMLIWDEQVTGISANLNINYKDKFVIGDKKVGQRPNTYYVPVFEKDVTVINAGIRKDFFNHQLTVFANVNNLMDVNFYEGDGHATEGRNFDIGVTYRF